MSDGSSIRRSLPETACDAASAASFIVEVSGVTM